MYHDYHIFQNSFTTLKIFWTLVLHLPFPTATGIIDLFIVSIVFAFLECHIVGIIQYVNLSDWLILLNNIHLSFFMFVYGWIAHFSLALNNIPLFRCTSFLVIHSATEEHLSCFQVWEITNKAIINIHMQSLCVSEKYDYHDIYHYIVVNTLTMYNVFNLFYFLFSSYYISYELNTRLQNR